MPPFDPALSETEIAPLFPDFDIQDTVKAGGQGAVFRIEHPVHGDSALKISSPVFYERVAREIQALRTIEHPAIHKLLDYGHENLRGQSCPFTITRYIEGEDLQDRIGNSGPIDEPQVRRIMSAISEALEVLWANRIVHRDIKPANILLKADGLPILIDLGVARHLDMSSLTATGHWLGTPGYMSPEQAAAQKSLTVKCDIFAFGITCYEVLTGEHPFYRNQALIMRGSPASPLRDRVACSAETSDLVARMIERRPVFRPMPGEIIRILRDRR